MLTLREYSPQIEIYSIDEMFLSFDRMNWNLNLYGHEIKNRIWQDIRMPVCVGIAPTKTLAKLANRAAKKISKTQGVCLMDEPHKWQWMLKRIPVTSVWGVASRTAIRLEALNISTAWELATANPKQVRIHSNVCLERTINELNGISCLTLEDSPPAKKQIYCTRSFGKKAKTLQPVLEAVSLYAARATEKLRQQNYLALSIHVFVQTSPFEPNFHSISDMVQLPYPTNDSRIITQVAKEAVKRLYSDGHAFLKAGVGLTSIVDKQFYQRDLFHPGQSTQSDKIMAIMDKINAQEGKGKVFLAAQGVNKPWYMRQQYTSPQYTTKWSDIPIVRV
jgi:DNA polymerase V